MIPPVNKHHQIRLATTRDIPRLVELHRQLFPKSRSTRFGSLYLRKMFRWFLVHNPALCFTAMQDDQLIGYLVGAINGYGRSVFRYAIFEIILGFLVHPKLWTDKETFLLWKSYLRGLLPARKNPPLTSEGADHPLPTSAALADIGVSTAHQGRGIGRELTLAFENAARKAGAELLTLSVAEDNLSARKVYEACDWRKDGEYRAGHSVHYSKKLV